MIVPGLSAAHSALHVVLCAAQVKAVCRRQESLRGLGRCRKLWT